MYLLECYLINVVMCVLVKDVAIVKLKYLNYFLECCKVEGKSRRRSSDACRSIPYTSGHDQPTNKPVETDENFSK